ETIEARHNRYVKACDVLLAGLDRLGLKHLVAPKNHSRLITTVVEPEYEGYSFDEMHDYLFERGFTIYPGKISSHNTFRIANIGQIDYRDMEQFIGLLEEYLGKVGYVK
ncbi:MAG: 2-aminoethylphosphonate--pyruvate transaminase, partial [Bacillota bacterium]|nr:2-aminoethylphosphonate--pyruvate transaminase [Bacillota bacterium]